MTEQQWLNNNELALKIWNNKYRNNNESFEDWLNRVSGNNEYIKNLIIQKKFLFGGRILSNRGITNKKTTLSNCYVLPGVEDTLESIFKTASNMARTFSYGGGVGIDLSNLRPKGATVNNAAKESSGPVSFMEMFSQVTQTISQSGRRGATIISIDINHPDIEEFIDVKTDLSKVNYANISVRMNNSFMKAVENDEDYILSWPCSEVDFNYETDAPYNELQSTTSIQGTQVYYKRVKAKKIFEKLAKNNWNYAEPGIIYWDRIESYNLLNNTNIRYAGVNPCSEEPLVPFGACLLSSINISEYVTNPFSTDANFDYQALRNDVRMIVFAMNDVLEEGIPLHPLKEQSETATLLRQIGIGTMGLADALIKLQVTYGSADSISIIKHVYKLIAEESIKASLELAKLYGCYPICEKEKLVESSFIKHLELPEQILEEIKQYGLRNSQLLTCAPTGSIATMLGISTGVEPIFAMHYTRTTKSLEGKDKTFEVYTPIAENYLKTHDALPEYFVSSGDIAPINRIKVQSALQEFIDASISSTINLDKDATIEDVYNIYMNAWKYDLKGVTVYRNGCAREGILNTESNKAEDLGENQCFNCITPVSRKTMGTTTGQTFCKKCACGTLYVTANRDSNGNFVELFTHTSKGGICQANLNAETRLISLALRSGVKIDEAIDQLKGIYCPACSLAKAKGQNIDGASCPDIISKVMQEFILNKSISVETVSGDKCPECGATLTHEGGCVTCTSCGYSKCS